MWIQFSDEQIEALRLCITAATFHSNQVYRDAALTIHHRLTHYQNNPGDPRYREAAQRKARDGEIEIDADAVISEGEDPGAYVMAWVWVYDDLAGIEHDDDDDDDCGICPTCWDLRCDGCTPDDTPSLDTSFHDGEMNVG